MYLSLHRWIVAWYQVVDLQESENEWERERENDRQKKDGNKKICSHTIFSGAVSTQWHKNCKHQNHDIFRNGNHFCIPYNTIEHIGIAFVVVVGCCCWAVEKTNEFVCTSLFIYISFWVYLRGLFILLGKYFDDRKVSSLEH